MAKTKRSKTEEVTDEIKESIDGLARLKIPLADYVEALEYLTSYMEAMISAAREDMERGHR